MERFILKVRPNPNSLICMPEIVEYFSLGKPPSHLLAKLELTDTHTTNVPFGFGTIGLTHSHYEVPQGNSSESEAI